MLSLLIIMKKHIPHILVYIRLGLAFLFLYLSYIRIPNYAWIAVLMLTLGLLTDVFDGIIARRLNCSTASLRRLDSTVDQVFFVAVALATFWQCPDFFKTPNHQWKLIIVGILETLAYLICFIKFKKEIATHSIGAKIWTLFMFAVLVEIMLTCQSSWLFDLFFILGVLTRLEIIAIILILKTWATDIPSVYHAWQLRKGLPIKKNKWFNS